VTEAEVEEMLTLARNAVDRTARDLGKL